MVALDRRSGRTLWANTDIQDAVGYASCVPAEIDDVPQIITLSAQRILAFDPQHGRLLWDCDFGNTRGNSATDVIVHDGLVYASSGYGGGSILLRPRRDGEGRFRVETVWANERLDNHHGGVVLVDGRLYGAGHQDKGWCCLEWSTGRQCWQLPGKGSLTYADGRLYCLDEKGTMSLLEPTPTAGKVVSSFAVPRGGRGAYWAHPVVCGGRLYVRHGETVYAYRVAEEAAR